MEDNINKNFSNDYEENACALDLEDYNEDEDFDEQKLFSTYFYKKNIDELTNIYDSLDSESSITKDTEMKAESIDETVERFKLDSEVIHSFTDNAKDDRELKKKYAFWLITILFIQMIIFNGIFIFNGLGKLTYTETVLNIYIGGGLIELISLVTIIVKYLFKDNISSTLNSILEKNKKDK